MKNSYSLFIGLLLLIGWSCMGCHPITKEETNISHPYEVFAINELGPPAGTYRTRNERGNVLRPIEYFGTGLVVDARMSEMDIHMPVDHGAIRDELLLCGSPMMDSPDMHPIGSITAEGSGDDWAMASASLSISELCLSLDDVQFFDQQAIILPGLSDWSVNVPDVSAQLFWAYFKDVAPEFDFDTPEEYLPTPDPYSGEQPGSLLKVIHDSSGTHLLPVKIKWKKRAAEKRDYFTDMEVIMPASLAVSEPKECTKAAAARLQLAYDASRVILAYRKKAEILRMADYHPGEEQAVFME